MNDDEVTETLTVEMLEEIIRSFEEVDRQWAEDLKKWSEVGFFGPGWPPTVPAAPELPDLIEVPLEEAVELLLRHHSSSVQVLLEKLKARGIVLARAR